jgi:hypothetical protein
VSLLWSSITFPRSKFADARIFELCSAAARENSKRKLDKAGGAVGEDAIVETVFMKPSQSPALKVCCGV